MEYTPRVSPTQTPNTFEPLGGGTDAQTVTGAVTWDLSIPADLAEIVSGAYREVTWYKYPVVDPFNPPADAIDAAPNPLSCFSFEITDVEITNVANAYRYDDSAEFAVNDVEMGPKFWHWGDVFHDAIVPSPPAVDHPVFGYEGPPIKPALYVRPGMISGLTPADQTLVIRVEVRMMALASYGQARVTIPSPNSAPPFMPYGTDIGTHIFSAHALNPLPGRQPYAINRIFRTLAMNVHLEPDTPTAFDARVLGGPWIAQAFVGKAIAEPDQCITVGIIQDLPHSTTPAVESLPQLDMQGPNSAIAMASKLPSEGARYTIYGASAHALTELFLHYP